MNGYAEPKLVTDEGVDRDTRFIINFEAFDDIARLMRTSNLELIEAIVSAEPASIRHLAEIVDRDYRVVHRNLGELESLGVIEFRDDGSRKKPILRGNTENIDFSIRFPQSTDRSGISGVSA